jgi:hypothetical protein
MEEKVMTRDQSVDREHAVRKPRFLHAMASTVRATLVASACLAVAMPTAANAEPADCLNGKNGFVEISDDPLDHKSTPHGSVSFDNYGAGSAKVTLRVGRLKTLGEQYRLGATGGQVRVTVPRVVGVDPERRQEQIQCGPFAGNRYNRPSTTSAKRANKAKNWKFRARGDAVLDTRSPAAGTISTPVAESHSFQLHAYRPVDRASAT